MTGDRTNQVVVKNGVAYFIQESHESGTEYISMIRRRDHVLGCEEEAVEDMPKQEL